MNPQYTILPDAPDDRARSFLLTDLVWNCFVLADLAPPYDVHARLPVALGPEGEIAAACLIYDCPGDRSMVPFGHPGAIRSILESVDLPDQTFLIGRDIDWNVLNEFFEPLGAFRSMSRMALTSDSFVPAAKAPGYTATLLRPDEYGEVDALYQLEVGLDWKTGLFPQATFVGARDEDEALCAVAAATAINLVDNIGTIGGVFTRPELRGRGLGRAVTSLACEQWFASGRDCVFLNVNVENHAARRTYKALGFTERLTYRGLPARLRIDGQSSDAPGCQSPSSPLW